MEKRSRLRDFIAFLATIRGDISNITAPPFFLAPLSVVELPSCWTERPSLFRAVALEPDPQLRALRVLRWILCSLGSQFYVIQDVKAGMRKPLNAFLGELFFGQWNDGSSTTRIISEQVSHHPPITACYMWDDKHGIRGDGYTRVEMSFNGSLNVRQTGHAMLHVDQYNEDHLIPFPGFTVKGFLSGNLYPELVGTYHIISSSGFTSEINFSGRGFFSGVRNSFDAVMYRTNDETKSPLYTAGGQWSGEFTITDQTTGTVVENCVPDSLPPSPLIIPDISEQDPWESRNAWSGVLGALKEGDIPRIVKEKSKLEEAQRKMRRKEAAENLKWEPHFFCSTPTDPLFEKLASGTGWRLQAERTMGVWKFDKEKAKRAIKPYRGALTPFG